MLIKRNEKLKKKAKQNWSMQNGWNEQCKLNLGAALKVKVILIFGRPDNLLWSCDLVGALSLSDCSVSVNDLLVAVAIFKSRILSSVLYSLHRFNLAESYGFNEFKICINSVVNWSWPFFFIEFRPMKVDQKVPRHILFANNYRTGYWPCEQLRLPSMGKTVRNTKIGYKWLIRNWRIFSKNKVFIIDSTLSNVLFLTHM